MRGSDIRTGDLFSYVDLEQRVPANHPLRLIRRIVNEVLAALDSEFGRLYATEGRPSIAPERREPLAQGEAREQGSACNGCGCCLCSPAQAAATAAWYYSRRPLCSRTSGRPGFST